MKYNYHCRKCGGFVAEPFVAYGYSGQFCHCEIPTPPTAKETQSVMNTPDTEWEVDSIVEALAPKVTIRPEDAVKWGTAKHVLQSALDAWYKDFVPALEIHLRKTLSSRDTYWKERVKERDDYWYGIVEDLGKSIR